MESNQEAAFISGAFKWTNLQGYIGLSNPVVCTSPYLSLLEHNYIGRHSTVLYRRSIVEKYYFDTR
jgi:hypothetical protein